MKNNSLIKFFAVIGVIFVVSLLVFAIGGVLFFQKTSNGSKNLGSQTMRSLDSEFYILHIPQNFEEIDQKQSNGRTAIHYGWKSDPYASDAGIDFTIIPKSAGVLTCEEDFEETRKYIATNPGAKFIKGEQFDLPNAIVCDSTWSNPVGDGKSLNDSVVARQRVYIGKNKADSFFYVLLGNYFESHPENFKQGVNESLSKFELK